MTTRVHIDTFESAGHCRTYAQVKAAVLRAGRYSVFEACERPGIYERIDRDPELHVARDHRFPWIGPVTRRQGQEVPDGDVQ